MDFQAKFNPIFTITHKPTVVYKFKLADHDRPPCTIETVSVTVPINLYVSALFSLFEHKVSLKKGICKSQTKSDNSFQNQQVNNHIMILVKVSFETLNCHRMDSKHHTPTDVDQFPEYHFFCGPEKPTPHSSISLSCGIFCFLKQRMAPPPDTQLFLNNCKFIF